MRLLRSLVFEALVYLVMAVLGILGLPFAPPGHIRLRPTGKLPHVQLPPPRRKGPSRRRQLNRAEEN